MKLNSPSCSCGKCAGCRLFRPTYKVENGRTFPTKADYLTHLHQKEAKEIIRQDKKASDLRKWIEKLPDDNRIRHSHAIPLHLIKRPTRQELEIGIPQCCNHETMQVSRFADDMWYCRHCRKSRLR